MNCLDLMINRSMTFPFLNNQVEIVIQNVHLRERVKLITLFLKSQNTDLSGGSR